MKIEEPPLSNVLPSGNNLKLGSEEDINPQVIPFLYQYSSGIIWDACPVLYASLASKLQSTTSNKLPYHFLNPPPLA